MCQLQTGQHFSTRSLPKVKKACTNCFRCGRNSCVYSVPARDELLWTQAPLRCITALQHCLATLPCITALHHCLASEQPCLTCKEALKCNVPLRVAPGKHCLQLQQEYQLTRRLRPCRASHHVHGTSTNVFCFNAFRECNATKALSELQEHGLQPLVSTEAVRLWQGVGETHWRLPTLSGDSNVVRLLCACSDAGGKGL